MAGSNDSGQDMEAGRTNRASNRTRIWASQSTDGESFEGPAILIVEPQLEPREDDESIPFGSAQEIVGVMATGASGPNAFTGTGVLGTGGVRQGVGIIGVGGGEKEIRGTGVFGIGTFGLHGVGVSTAAAKAPVPPGAGLVAQGGRRKPDDSARLLHGAGVIALAGGADRPIPGLDLTGSVGVYAQGGDSETITTSDAKGTVITGQPHPGPGILGRGGTTNGQSDRQVPASGVVGIAGGTSDAPRNGLFECGVYGAGPSGLYGWSANGTGCRGTSQTGRGGRFSSDKSAQLNLQPNRLAGPGEVADATAGDMLVVTSGGVASLWFCKRSSVSQGGASWVQLA